MNDLPKYFILNRKTIGTFDIAKRVIEAIAAASTLSEFPWIGFVLIALRVALSGIVSSAIAANPINISASSTVSQPDPIQSLPDSPNIDVLETAKPA